MPQAQLKLLSAFHYLSLICNLLSATTSRCFISKIFVYNTTSNRYSSIKDKNLQSIPYSTQKMLFFFHWGLFLVTFGSINVVTANAKLLNWSFFGKPNGNRIFRCQNVDFNSFRLHKLKRIPFNWCYKLITLNQLGIYVGVFASINRYVYDWLLEKLTINMLFWPSHRRCRLGIRLINLIPLKIDVGNTLWVLYNWWWRTMLSRELPLWSNKLKV